MRIVFVSDVIFPFTKGGSEIRNHEIAKRLAKKGHRITVIGGKFWKGQNKIYKEGVEIIGLSEIDYPRTTLKSLKLMIETFKWLLKNEYDLIENQHFVFHNCYIVKLASILKKKPLVFHWQQHFGEYLKSYFNFPKNRIAITLEKISLKLSKNNIASSEKVKSDLAKEGINPKNIEVFENGIDLEKIKKSKSSKDKSDLIFVGRLSYQKNLELLIKATSIVRGNFPNIRLLIIGEGEDKNKLQSLTRELNLEESIKFLGNKNHKEIFSLMKSSKIFVLPSRFEGFPLTAIEANACGLPIITPNFKQNRTTEFIRENGIVCQPDEKDMANSIIKLLKDKNLRKNMGKEGTKITKNMDWNNQIKKLEEYYLKLIK